MDDLFGKSKIKARQTSTLEWKSQDYKHAERVAQEWQTKPTHIQPAEIDQHPRVRFKSLYRLASR